MNDTPRTYDQSQPPKPADMSWTFHAAGHLADQGHAAYNARQAAKEAAPFDDEAKLRPASHPLPSVFGTSF